MKQDKEDGLQLILRKGEEGLRQDLLIEGKEYEIYRDGIFLGIAKYLDDPHNGEGFFIEKDYNERPLLHVCAADEWVFA